MEWTTRLYRCSLFPFHHIIEMGAKEMHKAGLLRIWKNTFGIFFRVCPFCIHFCAILFIRKLIQPQPDLTGPGAVLAVLLPRWLIGLV